MSFKKCAFLFTILGTVVDVYSIENKMFYKVFSLWNPDADNNNIL